MVDDGSGVLAVVGARSGSKGLPDKNLRPLGGHPLLAWAVGAARRATRVDRVVVSTDADRYAEVARAYGAEVPVLRPVELAADDSPDVDYVAHVLDVLAAREGYRPAVVLRLLPTVPFQTHEDLDGVIATLVADADATSAVVVAPSREHAAKALRLADDAAGRVRLVPYAGDGGVEPAARQGHAPSYHRSNVVATRPSTIAATGTLTGPRVAAHVIAPGRAIDIDTAEDLRLAEALLDVLDPAPVPPTPVTAVPTTARGA